MAYTPPPICLRGPSESLAASSLRPTEAFSLRAVSSPGKIVVGDASGGASSIAASIQVEAIAQMANHLRDWFFGVLRHLLFFSLLYLYHPSPWSFPLLLLLLLPFLLPFF